jgi:hypothetical protein
MASLTQDHPTSLATFMMVVEALDSTSMLTITATLMVEMDTTIMEEMVTMVEATSTMVATIMAMAMEETMAGTATTQQGRTSAKCSVSSARIWDIMPMNAQRQSWTMGTTMGASPTHSRRGM